MSTAEGQIADAAVAYCEALKRNEDAEPSDWESARARLDAALFDLQTACGYRAAVLGEQLPGITPK